jgi:hypothetical protein
VQSQNSVRRSSMHRQLVSLLQLIPEIPTDNPQCLQRDRQHCVLTGNGECQVAHIYPQLMLDQSLAPSEPFDFWTMLQNFWSIDRIQKWWDVIFTDQNSLHKGIETCHNLISLSYDAHVYWTKAYFALKPLQLSGDQKALDVEFHWLPKYRRSTASTLDILAPPESPEGSRADMRLYNFSTDRRICSGQVITLTTEDPEKQPLPHPALLEMQWILQRLTAMSGGAEINDNFDNEDDDAMALWNEEYPYEEEWGFMHGR